MQFTSRLKSDWNLYSFGTNWKKLNEISVFAFYKYFELYRVYQNWRTKIIR
jgi:hypothetical protein